MGDRGNIAIKQHDSTVKEESAFLYLYSHWAGRSLPHKLQKALIRGKDRWSDEPYLSRIIFCEMIGSGNELQELTGFGITTYITDNEHPLLVVDAETNTVSAAHEGSPEKTYK